MPSNTVTSPVVRARIEVDLEDAGLWSAPQKVNLGLGGRITRSTFRAPDSSTVTSVDLMVWEGPEEGYAPGFDPAVSVPDEDRVLYRTGIVVAGDDIDADDDVWLNLATTPAEFHTPHYLGRSLWAAVLSNVGTAQPGAIWVLRATETV